jgi:L-ascorbate metabolism protein UlaG (beta-lactamase superfamily)
MTTPASGTFTWLGHGSLKIVSPGATQILVDPWVDGNPKFPDAMRPIDAGDVIVVTHGHPDHVGDAAEIARRLGIPIVCVPELAAYFASEDVEHLIEMNKGGTVTVGDLRITMVPAEHSSGVTPQGGGPNLDGGEPVGLILRADGIAAVYVAGDTTVFGVMSLIRELYDPQLAIIPIDGTFNMGPYEAAYACRLLGVPRVVPVHWGTFPLLAGTPTALRAELEQRNVRCEVIALEPGESIALPG